MVNPNYLETPEGDIIPNHEEGSENEHYFPIPDKEQPDLFHVESLPEAGGLGKAIATDYMQNPDKYGSDWPSANMEKAAKHLGEKPPIPKSIREAKEKLGVTSKPVKNSAEGATAKYVQGREDVLGK